MRLAQRCQQGLPSFQYGYWQTCWAVPSVFPAVFRQLPGREIDDRQKIIRLPGGQTRRVERMQSMVAVVAIVVYAQH